MITQQKDYNRQIAAQINQYAEVEDMHNIPPSAHYIHKKYLIDRLDKIFGIRNIEEFYAKYIAQAVQRSGCSDVVSLGSGYGSLEIAILKCAKALGLPKFRIICLELSPILTERARQSAISEGLEDSLIALEADINRRWQVDAPVAGVMAHHALHHFVELEAIFSQAASLIHDEGIFITSDMIGRNGHMRWPETLKVLRSLWPRLPDRLKFNHSFGRNDKWFENWDCSIEGFEGIRAQDILPIMLDSFVCERFYANGGIVDLFVDRGFGPNIIPENSDDQKFLDQLQQLEDELISLKLITPTLMFAVMRPKRPGTAAPAVTHYMERTPENSIRKPGEERLVPALMVDDFIMLPYQNTSSVEPKLVRAGEKVWFGKAGTGPELMRWGWEAPEVDFTWSSGIDSAIEFITADTIELLRLQLTGYLPTNGEKSFLTITLNNENLVRIDLTNHPLKEFEVKMWNPLVGGSRVLLEFSNTRPRRPDVDDGNDKRPIGFQLVSLTTNSATR